MNFASIQSRGDAAYDAILAQDGDPYDAAVAYQSTVMRLRQEEMGCELMWLCPVCSKVETPIGTACWYCVCVQEEHDARTDRHAQAKARHGT